MSAIVSAVLVVGREGALVAPIVLRIWSYGIRSRSSGCWPGRAGGPPNRAELVFERFRRRYPSGVGSGLGLAIVRATAERHAGRAYLKGARFTIELPTLTNLSRSPARTSA
jgi:hypothetical protein